MNDITNDITQSEEWRALDAAVAAGRSTPMSSYFAIEEDRLERFCISVAGIHLDASKNLMGREVHRALLALAEAGPLTQRIEAMYRGDEINTSEGRPAWHVALRDPAEAPAFADDIRNELARVRAFAASVRDGTHRGQTGKAMTDIVNIGIGGSDLGPKMVCLALEQYRQPNLRFHFISNVDGAATSTALNGLSPETTLLIVSSKTFTTQETMMNARAALAWLAGGGIVAPERSAHLIAVTADPSRAGNFGIPDTQIFRFWDWVGGRYSLWSSIGLSIALCVGGDGFDELLAGAREMDDHFATAPFATNLPVTLALVGLWYNNFLNAETQAVIPYCERLTLLPAFLQQLDMESNGKSVTRDGSPVTASTGPIVWGQTGTNGQHAFFQLLHQGRKLVPVDFIGCIDDDLSTPEHHRVLLANMVAQSAALMSGEESSVAYKDYPGNRPSNVLLLDRLTPRTLGALIATYEHKVFVQGTLWNINSYDQWGVELGKRLASALLDEDQLDGFDPSTRALAARIPLLKKT